MARRFVIQAHFVGGGRHFDLMIEDAAALATWRLEHPPALLAPDAAWPAQRLPDHRRAYLGYEGPVRGGRGFVRIADAGTCRVLASSLDRWIVLLEGRLTRGRFELTRSAGTLWRIVARPSGREG